MTSNYINLQLPLMIPVNTAAITIQTCSAEEADKLTDLKTYFQVHHHLFSLLSSDDVAHMINWFDGRPKTMSLTLWTGNQAAIQYASAQDLLDKDQTIETAIYDYFSDQEICCECAQSIVDELLTQQVALKQSAEGLLFVDLGTSSTIN